MTGRFIAFEGIDGCGKSTQIAALVEQLTARGIEALVVREPGGTALGERVRELLLDPATGDIAPAAEALLYAASRAELVATVIRPALHRGAYVIADRFVGSSLVYQGVGRGLGFDEVLAANALALDGLLPECTILLELDPAEARARLRATGAPADRIEQAGEAFFARVAQAYTDVAASSPGWVSIAASGSANAVQELVSEAVFRTIGPQLVGVPDRGEVTT